ncbi:MAG: MaoC family dehydratase [Oscillospiraceae bacterium]|nr:MaoC family dehydratase [Oscillospiraceae bacterium]
MSVIQAEACKVRDPLINGFSYDELNIGDVAYFVKTITEHDVYDFAGITGDFNPAHVNQQDSEQKRFHQRIAHGVLSCGLISAALGTRLPGEGCLYVSQFSKFVRPVKFGDTLTVRLEVTEKLEAKRRVKIKTEVFNQNDELVTTGEAEMLPK